MGSCRKRIARPSDLARILQRAGAMFAIALAITPFASSSTSVANTAVETSASDPSWQSPIYYDLQPSTEPLDTTSVEAMTPEQLLRLFMDLHTAMEFEEAAAAARLLIERLPEHPVGYYNLACALSRLRNVEAALEALEQSIHYGWRNVRHMRLDADLDGVRHKQRYDDLLVYANRMNQVERMAAQPLRRDSVEEIVADIEAFTPELMARFQTPGMSIALIRNGELVWTGGFGPADADADAPVRLAAPRALLALLAAQQLDNAGALPLESLLRDAAAMRQEQRLIEQPRAPVVRSVGWHMPAPEAEAEPDPFHRNHASAEQLRAAEESIIDLLITAVEIASDQSFDAYCEMMLLSRYGLESTSLGALSGNGAAPEFDSAVNGTRELTTTCTDMAQLLAGICSRPPDTPAPPVPPAHDPLIDERTIEYLADLLGELQEPQQQLGARFQRTRAGGRIDVQEVASDAGCLLRFYPGNRSGIAITFDSPNGIYAARSVAHLALGGTE